MAQGINFKFPIQRSTGWGYATMTTNTLEARANDVLLLLGTNHNQRFNTQVVNGLDDSYLFENINNNTKQQIINTIKTKIGKYFTDIIVKEIKVSARPEDMTVPENQFLLTVTLALKQDTTTDVTLRVILP